MIKLSRVAHNVKVKEKGNVRVSGGNDVCMQERLGANAASGNGTGRAVSYE